MPKATKDTEAKSEPSAALSFEEALRQLEAVIDSMESGDLPLESMLARCEEGARLSQMCQAKLAEAEVKIQRLERAAGGEFATTPLSLAADTPEA